MMKRYIIISILLMGICTNVYAYEPHAKQIVVDDSGSYFSGANVETVLQEIGAKPFYVITSTLINNWNAAYGWGNHAGLYLPVAGKAADADTLDGHDAAYFQVAGNYLTPSSIDDTAYGASWDNVTTIAPSKNAVYDKMEGLAGGHDAVTVTDGNTIDFTLTDQDLTAEVKSNIRVEKIAFIIDGHGAVIAASASGHKVVPFACTVTGWEITSSASGSIVVDIKKSTYGTFGTFNSIAGTEKPTITTGTKNTDTSLTSFTTSVSVGDRIQAVVDSADINGVVVVTLYITKT